MSTWEHVWFSLAWTVSVLLGASLAVILVIVGNAGGGRRELERRANGP